MWGSGCVDPRFFDLDASWRWGSALRPAAISSWKEPLVPIGWKAGWAPEPFWTSWRRENSCLHHDSNCDSRSNDDSYIYMYIRMYALCAHVYVIVCAKRNEITQFSNDSDMQQGSQKKTLLAKMSGPIRSKTTRNLNYASPKRKRRLRDYRRERCQWSSYWTN
jgi:hypothetical protein